MVFWIMILCSSIGSYWHVLSNLLLQSSILKIEAADCPETLVTIYKTRWHYNPEDHNPRHSNRKSNHTTLFCVDVLYRYRKAPIIILDEPDGSLDQRNVSKFVEFLKQNIHLQIIIITHRNRSAYATVADDVIGIVKEVRLSLDGW